MKIVKGPSGFGDAIYTRAIVEWLLKNKETMLTVQTKYPNIFADLPVQTTDLSYQGRVDYDAKYIYDKEKKGTNQFQDMLNSANLPDFELASFLADRTKQMDNIIVIEPYSPMAGVSTSEPMKPYTDEQFNYVCEVNNGSKIINIERIYKWLELVDIFNSAKLVISQVGWAIPLAEMLGVPAVTIFTERALQSNNKFISTITPNKICTKKSTTHAILK